MDIVLNELPRYDSEWVRRKRSLCTQTVFKIVSTAHVLHSSLKSIPAPTSDAAVCKAIAKMSSNLFHMALRAVNEKTGIKARRVFALDGSWIRLPPSFASTRHKLKGSNCLGLLSVLIDVNTKQPVEWRWGGKNERNHALSVIGFLRPGDVVIMDRGYFSKKLLQQASLCGIKVLFRVTRSIFKGCKRLRKHNTSVVIGTVPVRLYHAMIQGHAFFFLSNIFTSTENIKHLYKRRWSVETFFKQLKYTYSCLRCVSKSEHSFLVRLGAIILFHWGLSTRDQSRNIHTKRKAVHQAIVYIVCALGIDRLTQMITSPLLPYTSTHPTRYKP
jgi:hypothetical protein